MKILFYILSLALSLAVSTPTPTATALTYKGTPYRYGGLSSRGIDCSGLVVQSYLSQGILLPHKASNLYKLGKKIQQKDLKQGDLLFFGRRRISHVGIYLGDGYMIHASSRQRKVVVVKYTTVYNYRGAKRLQS